MKPINIYIATTNPVKFDEISAAIDMHLQSQTQSADLITYKKVNMPSDLKEDGEDYIDNAIIKARAAFKLVPKGSIIIADDSGIEIDFLDGAPGMYTHRYLGVETSYFDKMTHIINHMKNVPFEERKMKYISSMILSYNNEFIFGVKTESNLTVSQKIQGQLGCGIDPICYVDRLNRTLGELPITQRIRFNSREKSAHSICNELISHRIIR